MDGDLLRQIQLNDSVPTHVAVIMDGNGRWARERSLPRPLGHAAGMTAVRETVEGCLDAGVGILSMFAFSQENWQRPVEEIDALMDLLETYIAKELAELRARAKITRAARRLAEEVHAGTLHPAEIDETAVAQRLYTASIPDPDLLIRTSGEMRISNFLLWQLAYAELYVTPVLWPDFTRRDLFEAILALQRRDRRFGRVTA
jgi:undecaprenyl diphosphate synthase